MEVIEMPNRIKEIAKKKNVKIVQLSKDTGLARSYLYDLINEKSSPNLKTARLIAEALNSTINELFPDDLNETG
jgi:transcriptional regulator with XRE-family HTH domain